jgi:hypothetical protein
MKEFVPFQSFFTEAEAAPIIEILKERGIEYKIEKLKELLDPTITGHIVQNKIFLLLQTHDFPKANEALDDAIMKNIRSLDSDYYLFSFSNDELHEIIHKPDEWSRQDFLIARKILSDRGINVDDAAITSIKRERIRELAVQERGDLFWISVGYVMAIIGGLLSLVIALPFILARKTLPDGSRMFIYDTVTRRHGRNILIIAGVVILLSLFVNDKVRYVLIGFLGYFFS